MIREFCLASRIFQNGATFSRSAMLGACSCVARKEREFYFVGGRWFEKLGVETIISQTWCWILIFLSFDFFDLRPEVSWGLR